MAAPHDYTSTACLHEQCGSCRQSCKYCDAPCQHGCHREAGLRAIAGVDQARGIARELLEAARPGALMSIDPELLRRIESDPALFWLRGEEAPPGCPPLPGDD
jgi:hypothetical protein